MLHRYGHDNTKLLCDLANGIGYSNDELINNRRYIRGCQRYRVYHFLLKQSKFQINFIIMNHLSMATKPDLFYPWTINKLSIP